MRLPNNNVLMTWTDAGYLSEHTDDDKVLMEARFLNETRLATYRVYKSTNWVGTPKQPPDIKAIGYGIGANSMTAIYVSWNGATEHNIKLFSGDKFIGQTNRTGFETVFVTDFHAITVRAAAYDVNGKFLGRSNDVPVEYANGWVPEPTDLLHTEPLQLSEDVGNMIPGPFDQSAPIDDVGLPDIQIPPVNAIQPSDPASGVGNKIADLPTPTVQYTKPTTPNQMPTMSPTSVRSEKWI
ncbi:hypothetical protein F5B22DRAFT_587327 [Xylaria bambusicola]|uniref:uncharacterized protein n=1 Tax=Xylaria bambusicola TaxID=326684 RepID=UPI002007DF6C|nr:uncharacterized protein F5B22DRAFT_587327 [Xylaria bambusicola]KAI0526731.1 hypothetical protein F5B22DRAFT_587327 [Xylaria bambusicola]